MLSQEQIERLRAERQMWQERGAYHLVEILDRKLAEVDEPDDDEGPPEDDVRYCDHDVPGGCDLHRRAWAWDEYIAAGGQSPWGSAEEDLAVGGPAWQDEQNERRGYR